MTAVLYSFSISKANWQPSIQWKQHRSSYQASTYQSLKNNQTNTHKNGVHFHVFASSKDSSKSGEPNEVVPSWARPDADEPPPWARGEDVKNELKEGSDFPFIVYLLASAITAIAAIGSVFEYVNQKPVFGLLNSDSVLYAPLLGFFAFTGIPTSAFLWFKSVQVANKEAEEQDKRDGFR